MSNPYESLMQSLQATQQSIGEKKKARLQNAEAEKRRLLDPGYEEFDPDMYTVTDADTLRHRRTGEEIRVQGNPGESIDSFETHANTYAKDPERFKHHQRAYAKMFGKNPDQVTVDDLTGFGNTQKQNLMENLESMRGTGMHRSGTGEYGRTLAQFDNQDAFEQARGSAGNASYFAPSNWRRQGQDIASGKMGEMFAGKGERSWKQAGKDQFGNVLSGGLNLLNSTLQAGAIATGQGAKTNEFFGNNEERVANLKDSLTGANQQFRERMQQKRKEHIQDPLFEQRQQAYLDQGDSANLAKVKAMTDEFKDTIGDLIQHPGRILDATTESLPAMAGVAAAGVKAAAMTARHLGKKILKEAGEDLSGLTKKEIKKKIMAAGRKQLETKPGQALMKKVSRGTGITTIGLMEGTSNAAEAYSSVMSMTEEEASQSTEYLNLRQQGLSHEQAKEKLANKVYGETLFTTTALAGATAAALGVGAFEARLASRAFKEPVKKASTGARKAVSTTAKATRAVAGATGRTLKPGAQEFGEELIQSGGGELLQQKAQARQGLLDESQVGKGVGAIAAEGALAGLAAGTGGQAVSKAGKSVAKAGVHLKEQAKPMGEAVRADYMRRQETRDNGESVLGVGGSRAEAAKTAEEFDKKSTTDQYDEATKIVDDFMGEGKDPATKGRLDVSQYRKVQAVVSRLQGHIKTLAESGDVKGAENLIKNIQPLLVANEKIKDSYKTALKQEYQKRSSELLLGNKPPSEESLVIAQEALQEGVISHPESKETIKKLLSGTPEQQKAGRVLNQTLQASTAVREAQQLEKKLVEGQVATFNGTGRKRMEEVANEKMGDVVQDNGNRGLENFQREMVEASQTKDAERFQDLQKGLRNFVNSQQSRLAAVAKAVADNTLSRGTPIPDSNGMWYDSEATPKLLQTMQQEQDKMVEAERALNQMYNEQNTAPTEQVEQVAPVKAPKFDFSGLEVVQDDRGDATQAAEDTVAKTTDTKQANKKAQEGKKQFNKKDDKRPPDEPPAQGQLFDTKVEEVKAKAETKKKEAKQKAVKQERSNKGKVDRQAAKEVKSAPVQAEINDFRETAWALDLEEPTSKNVGPFLHADQKADFDTLIENGLDPKLAVQQAIQPQREVAQAALDKARSDRTLTVDQIAEYQELLDKGAPKTDALLKDTPLDSTGIINDDTAVLEGKVKEKMKLGNQITQNLKKLDQLEKAGHDVQTLRDNLEKFRLKPFLAGKFIAATNILYKKAFPNEAMKKVSQIPANTQGIATSMAVREFKDEAVQAERDALLDQWIEQATNKDKTPLQIEAGIFKDAIKFFQKHGFPDANETILAGNLSLTDVASRGKWGIKENNLLDKLKAANVPNNIADVFQATAISRDSKNSWVSALPNLGDMLANPLVMEAIVGHLELGSAAKSGVTRLGQLYKELANTLDEKSTKIHDKEDPFSPGYKKGATAHIKVKQNPTHLLRGQDGKLNRNVVLALAGSIMEWTATDGLGGIYNDQPTVAKMIGQKSDYIPNPGTMDILSNKGSMRTRVADQVGSRAYNMLGIANSDLVSGRLEDRMKQALGSMMLSAMEDLGYLESQTVTKADWANIQSNEGIVNLSERENTKFIRVAAQKSTKTKYDEPTPKADALITRASMAAPVFSELLGMEHRIKGPQAEPSKGPPKKMRGSISNIAPKLAAAVDFQQKIPWSPTPVLGLIEDLGQKRFLDKVEGYHQNTDTQQPMLRKGMEGKNRNLNKDFKSMMDHQAEFGDTPFYMDYFVATNGRTHMDSTTVNMQNSKIHRFAYAMDAWERQVDTTDIDSSNKFKFTVAQAFGVDVDKMPMNKALKQLNEKLSGDSLQNAIRALQAREEGQELTDAQKDLIADQAKNTHMLAGMQEYARFLNAEKSNGAFNTKLMLEIDGITNGYIANILQLPMYNMEQLKKMLRSGGIYFKDDNFQDYGEYRDQTKEDDNYEDLGRQVAELMISDEAGPQADLEAAIHAIGLVNPLMEVKDGNYELTGSARKWAKAPFVPSMYSASPKAATRSMVNKQISGIYEKLNDLSDDSLDTYLRGLQEVMDAYKAFDPKQRTPSSKWIDKAVKEAKGNGKQIAVPSNVIKSLEKAINATYGRTLEVVLKGIFETQKVHKDTLNTVSTLSNVIFEQEFNRRKELYEQANDMAPGKRQEKEILQQMHAQGYVPSLASPLSEGIQDQLEMAAFANTPLKAGKNEQGSTKDEGWVSTGFNGEKQDSRIATRSPSPKDVGVRTGPVAIQGSDGAVNGASFGKFEVLNVFDALGTAFDEAFGPESSIHNNNKEFFEQHRDWSMVRAQQDHLNRMMTLVTGPNAPLANQFGFIEAHMAEMAAERKDKSWKGIDELKDRMEETVAETESQRKVLFDQIRLINQFSLNGSGHEITSNVQAVPDTGDVAGQANQAEKLSRANAKGWLDGALGNFIASTSPTAQGFLDTITDMFHNEGQKISADALGKFKQTLDNVGLDDVTIRLAPKSQAKPAQYDSGTKVISIQMEGSNRSTNILQSALHEIAHVGQLENIERAVANDQGAEIIKMIKQDFAQIQKQMGKDLPQQMLDVKTLFDKHMKKGEIVEAIAEYVAHRSSDIDTVIGRLGTNEIMQSYVQTKDMGALTDMLKNISTRTEPVAVDSMGSGPVPLDVQNFEVHYEGLLSADTAQQILTDIESHDTGSLSSEANDMLDRVMDDVLIPGMRQLDAFTVQLDTRQAQRIAGRQQGQDIQLQSGQATPGMGSLKEAYVHEVLHGVLKEGLDNNFTLREEAKRLMAQAKENTDWTNLVPQDYTGDRAQAEAEAKALWDYMFNNEQDGIGVHEFVAIGLSNYNFATALSQLSNKDTRQPIFDGDGILPALSRILRRVMDAITNRRFDTGGGTLHSGLFSLAKHVATTNEAAKESLYNKVVTKANAAVTGKMEAAAKRIREGYLKKQKARMSEKLKAGEKLNVKDMADIALNAGINWNEHELGKYFNQLFRQMADGTNIDKNNMAYELAKEVMALKGEDYNFLDLFRESKKHIDMDRKRALEHTAAAVLNEFDPKLVKRMTQKQKTAMSNAVLRTDLSSLVETDADVAMAVELLRNAGARQAEITRTVDTLTELLPNKGLTNSMNNQAKGLGYFMSTGKVEQKNQMANASNIAKQFHRAEIKRTDLRNLPEVTKQVDRLASLYAMNEMHPEDRADALTVIDHEMARGAENGITNMVGTHKALKTEALVDGFDGDPVHMVKGHLSETLNPDIEVKVVLDTAENRRNMEEKGYKLHSELGHDSVYAANNDKAGNYLLYSSFMGKATYQKGIISLTDIHRMGTDLLEAMRSEGMGPGAHKYNNYTPGAKDVIKDMRDQSYRLAESAKIEGRNWRDEVNTMPVVDSKGNIVSYRYVMAHDTKREVMKMTAPFDQAMGKMRASVIDRNHTKDVNRKVVDLLHDEWINKKDEQMEGSLVPENKFIEISKHSADPRAREMYRLLPADMQEAIREKFGGDAFYVRDEVVNLVVGFRKLSVANTGVFGPGTQVAKITGRVWQDIIGWTKTKIAILNPQIAIGNFASNQALLLSEGIDPKFIADKSAEGIRAMHSYRTKVKQQDMLETKIASMESLGKQPTRAMRVKLAELRADNAVNPVRKLAEAGLVTSIVEDIQPNETNMFFKGKDKLKNKLKEGGSGMHNIMRGVEEAYMLPGSTTHQLAVNATQYGDFLGRYVKYQWDTTRKGVPEKKAIYDALSAFIYYDLPQNKGLTYANDMGLVMFTKFFLRIQHVVLRTFKNNPASAVGVLALQKQFAPGELGENIANYGLLSGASNKFKMTPWNTVMDQDNLTPSMLEWLNIFGTFD